MIDQQSSPNASIEAGRPRQPWQVPAVCLVLAAITFAVFGQTLHHQFIDLDDGAYVYVNPVVSQGLTLKGIIWAFSCHAANWHPLTWLSHMLDCQLYGLHPGGHHLTNVLLHTATVIVLFLVLRQMTGALWRSAFVAAVFAIHPLRVESVAWVAERKDVLSGLFFMLTIVAYVSYARRPWSFARYGLVVLLFVLGLMCKPMLVTLPVVLLLLDYWPLQRAERAKKLVLEKLPMMALSAASCFVTLLAQSKVIRSSEAFALPLRLVNALVTCIVYLGQMVYPAGLIVVYPYPHNGLPWWEVALACLLLAGFSAFAWAERRKQPWLLMGWLWYLVMLLPVVGIVQVGVQAHADRYTYLPQIGIYLAVTWLVAQWRVSRAVLGSLMAGVIAGLMVCAWKQVGYWNNNITMWTHMLSCNPRNAMANYLLGNALARQGKLVEATGHYQKALQLRPDFTEACNNLGNVLMQQGKADEAIVQFQKAAQIDPGNAEAFVNLGSVLQQKGRLDEAISRFQKALQLRPDYAQARNNLGGALLQAGRQREALLQFQQAVELEPADPRIKNNLAWLLATSPAAALRDGNKAVELAAQANKIAGGQNPVFLRTLAAALAETGRHSDAAEIAQRALLLAGTQSKTGLAAQLQSDIELYQAGKPLRTEQRH
ncbi:MAG: tetratricopeptide repeat protein [Limisphaerales bacterium]